MEEYICPNCDLEKLNSYPEYFRKCFVAWRGDDEVGKLSKEFIIGQLRYNIIYDTINNCYTLVGNRGSFTMGKMNNIEEIYDLFVKMIFPKICFDGVEYDLHEPLTKSAV